MCRALVSCVPRLAQARPDLAWPRRPGRPLASAVRQDGQVPTPPPPDVVNLFDDTPDEVESRAELDHHLARGTLAGLTVQGVPLDVDPPAALATADVTGTLFVGCRLAGADVAADLVRRGALVVPAFAGVPYPTHPGRLYAPEDLSAGFKAGGFAGMYDTVVYQHFRGSGGAQPTVREALVQRLHDDGIDARTRRSGSWAATRCRAAPPRTGWRPRWAGSWRVPAASS